MPGDPEKVNVAGGVLDDEEHVDPLEERSVHGEEVAGQDGGAGPSPVN